MPRRQVIDLKKAEAASGRGPDRAQAKPSTLAAT